MTHTGPEKILTDDERDILQEAINIAFGKASADLADLVNIYVTLNVPEVRLLDSSGGADVIAEEVGRHGLIHILEQNFWGKFKGVALLAFPSETGRNLVSLLNAEEQFPSDSMDVLERETILEVGNILVGACVGKLAELLEDVVTFSPPSVSVHTNPDEALTGRLCDPEAFSIAMKTVFSFKEREIYGYLFMMCANDSSPWLKKALNGFMEEYG